MLACGGLAGKQLAVLGPSTHTGSKTKQYQGSKADFDAC